jgi:ATP-dependent 26S proteasome regulatory subunit
MANAKNKVQQEALPKVESKFDKAIKELTILIRSRYPIVYMINNEKEYSVAKIVYDICVQGTLDSRFKKELYIWDITRGVVKPEFEGGNIINKVVSEQSQDPILALEWITNHNKDVDAIYILTEFHHYLDQPNIQRRLRVFSETTALSERKMIILLSTKNDGMPNSGKMIPPEMENIIHMFDWPYPDSLQIRRVLENDFIPMLNEGLEAGGYEKMDFNDEQMKLLINACKGMTIAQIDHATSKSVVVHHTLVPKTIATEKKQIIQKSGLCDYVEPNETMGDIGGVAKLKRWLSERKNVLSEEAFDFGCDLPNGVLLLGPWGSGKSSAAKAIINEWGLPGIRIDASKVYDQYVGASEQRIRSILNLAESISPVCIWWEEVENLLAGSESSASDGGTSSRVIGIISTFMQEHEGIVFNIFTANEIGDRPPKLFRKGRLDEIFIVDLPVTSEREEIFKIHVDKRLKRQGKLELSEKINYALLAENSNNFSGAEIEAAVNSGIIQCFNDGKRDLKTEDIMDAVNITIPLSCTMREKIVAMRRWQEGRAVLASDFEPEEIKDIKDYQTSSRRKIEI